jgi:mono/diheme cytochrome c family protein
MKIFERLPFYLVIAVVVLGVGIVGWRMFGTSTQGAGVAVIVPKLSPAAQFGKTAFDANCARCHGVNAAGTGKGPPLVNDIYNPGHHGDRAFVAAARRGTPQHHWSFGNMPPQPQVSDQDIAAIIRYVREMQQANGIIYKLHRM